MNKQLWIRQAMKLWKFRLHIGTTYHFITNRNLDCKQACDLFMCWYSTTFDTSYGQTITHETERDNLHIFYTYKDGWINHYWVKFTSEDFELERIY